MSERTKHLTQRQRAALTCEAHCKRQKRLSDRHWWKSTTYFAKMLNEQLYGELDFPNFSTWCASVGVSSSWGYAMAKLGSLPKDVWDSLQGMDIGKANLIVAKLEAAVQERERARCEHEVIEANETIKAWEETAEIAPTWHELRQMIQGDDPLPKWVTIECPRCHRELKASRAVTLDVT